MLPAARHLFWHDSAGGVAVQSLAWGSDEDVKMQAAIVRWTIALPYAMKAHCWKRRTLSKELHVSFHEL